MTIATVAAQMYTEIASQPAGTAQRKLDGGLEIILSRSNEHYWLTLRRPDVAPSAVELRIISRAFEVPEGTEPQAFARRARLPKSKEEALYRGYLISWSQI